MHTGQMEVLVLSLLFLVPTLGARLPLQNPNEESYYGIPNVINQQHTQIIKHVPFPESDSNLPNTIAQGLIRVSDNSESVEPTVNNLIFEATKPQSNLLSIGVAFEDTSLADSDSNIPSAPALEEGSGLNSEIIPSSLKSADGEVVCGEDEVLHVDGTCVTPIIRRNIFTFAEPITPPTTTVAPVLSPPVINYDIVFIKSPESNTNSELIIIPPPQHKTLVYVLNKQSPAGPNIIEVPSGHRSDPEVYFVNYNGATGRVDSGRSNSEIILPTGDHISNSGRPNSEIILPTGDHISNSGRPNSEIILPTGDDLSNSGRPNSEIILPTGDHLSNLLNANFLQSAISTAAAQKTAQESLSTPHVNTLINQNALNTNFVQSIGSTSPTQKQIQGPLSTLTDIRISHQNNIAPINNLEIPTFKLIDNSFINNIDLPKFEMIQNLGTASNEEILRRFGLDVSNINSLRRSFNI